MIWDEIEEEEFEFPSGKDRILVSYEAGAERVAYIEPVTVGDPLPAMPLFLTHSLHIQVPLEETYRATWEALPEELRTVVETGDSCPTPMPSSHPPFGIGNVNKCSRFVDFGIFLVVRCALPNASADVPKMANPWLGGVGCRNPLET